MEGGKFHRVTERKTEAATPAPKETEVANVSVRKFYLLYDKLRIYVTNIFTMYYRFSN